MRCASVVTAVLLLWLPLLCRGYEWGTLRPNLYFGVRAPEPDSPLFGALWHSLPPAQWYQQVRHECQEGDHLTQYGWTEHNGGDYGVHAVRDGVVGGLNFTGTFLQDPQLTSTLLRQSEEDSAEQPHGYRDLFLAHLNFRPDSSNGGRAGPLPLRVGVAWYATVTGADDYIRLLCDGPTSCADFQLHDQGVRGDGLRVLAVADLYSGSADLEGARVPHRMYVMQQADQTDQDALAAGDRCAVALVGGADASAPAPSDLQADELPALQGSTHTYASPDQWGSKAVRGEHSFWDVKPWFEHTLQDDYMRKYRLWKAELDAELSRLDAARTKNKSKKKKGKGKLTAKQQKQRKRLLTQMKRGPPPSTVPFLGPEGGGVSGDDGADRVARSMFLYCHSPEMGSGDGTGGTDQLSIWVAVGTGDPLDSVSEHIISQQQSQSQSHDSAQPQDADEVSAQSFTRYLDALRARRHSEFTEQFATRFLQHHQGSSGGVSGGDSGGDAQEESPFALADPIPDALSEHTLRAAATAATQAGLSNLLGGMGYFAGRYRRKKVLSQGWADKSEQQPDPASSLDDMAWVAAPGVDPWSHQSSSATAAAHSDQNEGRDADDLLSPVPVGEYQLRLSQQVEWSPHLSELTSCVPSRSFFPRGFLWDEGFHQVLMGQWNPRLSLRVLDGWFRLINTRARKKGGPAVVSGWLPREQILGSEARSRVPDQFVSQSPDVANPPTLLVLALRKLVQRAQTHQAGGGQSSGDGEYDPTDCSDEEAEELYRLLKTHYRPLIDHVLWYFRTQGVDIPAGWPRVPAPPGPAGDSASEGGGVLKGSRWRALRYNLFRWRDRTQDHCLPSGMDDYPRGPHPTQMEAHVDLHAWMVLLCETAHEVTQFLLTYTPTQHPTLPAKRRAHMHAVSTTFSRKAAQLRRALDVYYYDPSHQRHADWVVLPEQTRGLVEAQIQAGGYAAGASSLWGLLGPARPEHWTALHDGPFTADDGSQRVFSPHLGYASFFPLFLGLLDANGTALGAALQQLEQGSADPDHYTVYPRPPVQRDARGNPIEPGPDNPNGGKPSGIWSPFGLLSLSRNDPFYGAGENYWRGSIWMNLNYLALGGLKHYAATSGPHQDKAGELYGRLRGNVLRTVVSAYHRQGYFYEQYHPETGQGLKSHPFTGWTALIPLVLGEIV